MADGCAIAFVHGIGGPVPTATWTTPLNATLASARMPTLDLDLDPSLGPLINVEYLSVLQSGSSRFEPAGTWERPEPAEQEANWGRYLARKEHIRSLIEHTRKEGSHLPFAQFPTAMTDQLPQALPIVRRYLTDADARQAVWDGVLAQLPSSGRIVLVAHSLGSIVMLDLLTRLPPDLHVSLLLTIGSPIGIGAFRDHLTAMRKAADFPADRIDVWVNAYDPDDIVTAGRGAAASFAAALDAPVETGLSHGISAYMSQPVVGAVIATAIFGPSMPAPQDVPARRIHPQWLPLLVRFAYTQELWRTCPTQKWADRLRMDTARAVLAERAVTQAHEQWERMQEQVASLAEPTRSHLAGQLADQPFAPGRRPSKTTLLRDADELVTGQFSDEALVLSGVDLLLATPFAPFGLEVDDALSTQALGVLYQRIRGDGGGRSGTEFAEVIAGCVDETRRALTKRGIPWTPLLLGAGVLVLAGTGIGLAAAIPAGLAGAAAVTATLAAFGPGGIAGGVATLAVLSGTSAALATAGLALGGANRDEVERLQASMAEEIARMPTPAFRTAIAGLLAVHLARHRLGFDPRAEAMEFALASVQSAVLAEGTLHEEIAPKADATKQWRIKAEILDRAMGWSADSLRAEAATMRADIDRAIETGDIPVHPGRSLPVDGGGPSLES